MERPIVGILNTWSDLNPCNSNLRSLAGKVREGVLEAGGIPFELPLLSISENLIKPSAFPFRNLLAMAAEESIGAIRWIRWSCWAVVTRPSRVC